MRWTSKRLITLEWNREDLLVCYTKKVNKQVCLKILSEVYKEIGWKAEDCMVGYIEDGAFAWNLKDSFIWWVFLFLIVFFKVPEIKESFKKAMIENVSSNEQLVKELYEEGLKLERYSRRKFAFLFPEIFSKKRFKEKELTPERYFNPDEYFERELIPLFAETFLGKTLGNYKKHELEKILKVVSFFELEPIKPEITESEIKHVMIIYTVRCFKNFFLTLPDKLPDKLDILTYECIELRKRLLNEGCLKDGKLTNIGKLKKIIGDELQDIAKLTGRAIYEKTTICIFCLSRFNTRCFSPALFCPVCKNRYRSIIQKRIQRHPERKTIQTELQNIRELLKEEVCNIEVIERLVYEIREKYPQVFAPILS